MRTRVNSPTGWYYDDYCGMIVHRTECDEWYGGSYLKYIVTPEGRIVNNGDNYNPILSWEYDLKDHLGNTRVVIEPGTNAGYADTLQQTHYYPFGMRMSEISTSSGTNNRYLYNGKEMQDDFGLNWYDYGARFYDPALGRWHSVDPMAELYDSYSPYNYALNNPILFLDPNGMWVATAGGYSTDDPEEIARFLSYKKAENAVNNINPDVDQMTGFIEGEMNNGGKLSDGSHLISDITTTKQNNGSWKVDQESFHQAWVDVYQIQSGGKYHFGPVEGEPVMRSLDSWYAKAWHGMNGGRDYNGYQVNSQGLITGNMTPITGMAPTPGKAGNAIKWAKVMSGKDVVKMLKKKWIQSYCTRRKSS